MLFSMSLGLVGLCYAAVILCVYFWKKRANQENLLSNLFFRFLVVFLVCLGFLEIACIISINYLEYSHPIFNEIICRLHILADTVWAAIFIVYAYSVTKKRDSSLKNYIKSRRILAIILIISISIFYGISCALPVTYHAAVKKNYMVIGGQALYPMYFSAATACLFITFLMIRYSFKAENNVKFPIIYFITLFFFLVAIEFIWFDFRVNYIYFVFCFIHMGMFFTIESQDTKLLNQVEESKKEAEIANKAKTEFLSNISHEIRTPMNTILGFSQALLSEKELTSEIVKRDSANIKEASSSLLDLINNILDISRIESGKEIVEEKDYKLDNLLFEINSVITSKITKDVLDFKINVDSNIPSGYNGDSGKIYKVITNILMNAIIHTKFGSVTMDVGGAYFGTSFRLSFLITNTGHEMTEAEFEKSFSDFADNAGTNNSVDSVKLGLIAAKSLINLMGGTIDFKNEKGKGTRYIISIDQTVVDDMKIGNIFYDNNYSDNQESKKDFTNKKVLVVDDNKMNLKLAIRILEQFNLNITTAENGKDCIELVKNNEYDIILLDHMMPELDGIATVHILRNNGCKKSIIALTANSYTGSRDFYIKEGFTDYLAKPIRYKDLYKILSKYIDQGGE